MGKAKVIVLGAALLAAFTATAGDGRGHFEWERVLLDGHRTAPGATLSPSAAKEAALLEKCAPALAKLQLPLGECPREMRAFRPESELTNWLADALLYQTGKMNSIVYDASIINYGGVRVEMPKGRVTEEDLRSMLPFPNTVVVLKMRGSRLYDVIDAMYRNAWEILGGIRVVASTKGIQSIEVAGAPLDTSRVYSVVTNSFLYKGGDGICLEKECESGMDTGMLVFDVIRDYMKSLMAEGKKIEARIDGRITLTDYTVVANANAGGKKNADVPGAVHPEFVRSASPAKLTIIHTNDTHSHLDKGRSGHFAGMGGIVERAAFIDSVRNADGKRNVLLLDAGDYSQGTPYFTLFEGKVEIEAMNILGYDVSTLGNHEWDNGAAHLASRLCKASFKTVLCNYEFENKAVTRRVKPYVIIRRGGLKIGIIGVLADITEVVDKGLVKGLSYIKPEGCINKWADYLKNTAKCDLVIVLSHCGFHGKYKDMGDTEFAPALKNVDVIIGGHTHTDLPGPVYINGADGSPIMIVTDYCWGRYAGVLKYFN